MLVSVLLLSLQGFPLQANLVKQGIKNVLDICSSGESIYYLNQFGVVYQYHKNNYLPLDLPDKIIQIQAIEKSIYLLREDGSVWEYEQGVLRLVDGELPNQQMIAVGSTLYLLKRSGGLSQYSQGVLRHLVYDRNFEVMVSRGHQSLFMIDSWGRLFHYDTYSNHVELLDPARDSVQLVAEDQVLYVLKKNGSVFKFEDLEFHPLIFTEKVVTMAADNDFLFFIDRARRLFEYNRTLDRLTMINLEGKPQMIRVSDGKLYVIEDDGDVFEYVIPSKKKQMQIQFHQMWNSPNLYPDNNGYENSQLR